MINELFDSLKAEKSEADRLIDNGIKFTVPKRSVLKYFSKKKERTFLIEQPYLGTLDYICRTMLEIKLDDKALEENPLHESKKIVADSAKKCALVLAMAVLNSEWKIKYLSRFFAKYLLWRVQPSKLLQLVLYINQINNLGDFINSIRLMSGIRTTAPKLVEEKQAG